MAGREDGQMFRWTLTALFLLGASVLVFLGVYLMSLFIFVFDTTIEYPGDIARTPKPMFLLSFLVLLWYIPDVQKSLEKLGFHD